MVSSYYLALQVISTVCSSSDLVGSVSSLYVWRCGHLLVFLLSGGKVQGDSLYKLLSRTGLPLTCLVVLACHGSSIQREGSALVIQREPLARLPDLVEKRCLARNASHGHLVSEPRPLMQIWRPKRGFSEASLR